MVGYTCAIYANRLFHACEDSLRGTTAAYRSLRRDADGGWRAREPLCEKKKKETKKNKTVENAVLIRSVYARAADVR